MSYLSEEQFGEIAATVSIYPISSEKLGDISQYSFDCGDADEYVTFLRERAHILDRLCISKTFLVIHDETKELVGYFTLSADSVRLTRDEKDETELSEVEFMSLPAVKLGKLSVNEFSGKRKLVSPFSS